ncbi:uncharacterized protein JCM15063_004806 [Sporobolomyces koalae]|uniref:uncharacterized protein n=1 Tax=Sporobolomyces koalae TaxID=500713 RepID=UPI00316C22A8
MVFYRMHRRASSRASSVCSTSSASSSSSSTSSYYEPFEEIQGNVPHELVELPKPASTKRCTLEVERESWSNPFSFPRSHTHHHVCPKHGIRHDPFLALPGREERSFETGHYKPKKISLRKIKTNKF